MRLLLVLLFTLFLPACAVAGGVAGQAVPVASSVVGAA